MAFACVSGTVVALVLLAMRRAHGRTRLPFGVFLALGGIGALFAGPAFLSRYFGVL
jgi:prepilin signal peptidase PulO-like enzyme (type II secretory pathway)